jgi:hypothetical protein
MGEFNRVEERWNLSGFVSFAAMAMACYRDGGKTVKS